MNQPLQCLFVFLLPILQFNQSEQTKIPLELPRPGAGSLGSQTLALPEKPDADPSIQGKAPKQYKNYASS
jgi:hypothetical protein